MADPTEVPINVTLDLGINIHRHNGKSDDDCEVTLGGGHPATMRPDAVAAYVASWIKDVLPGAIKNQTGFDVAAVQREVV